MYKMASIAILITGLLAVTSVGTANDNQQCAREQWVELISNLATDQSMSSELRSESIDSFIMSKMNLYHVPGMACAAIFGGEIVWSKGYGFANIEEGIPTSDSTLFMLASISKTFTGTALMQLWEKDLFELDDNINNYMSFEIINPNYPDSAIPFRSLMSHTSSLDDNWDVMYSTYVQGDTPIPLEQYVQDYFLPGGFYYDPMMNFELWPPEAYRKYCNHNFVAVGYLVQSMTGVPFDQYCNDSIFTPLGLTETSWFLDGLDTSNVAMPYNYSGGDHIPLGHFGYADYPAGTLRTSAVQLARFLNMFLHNGELDGVRILGSATVDSMLTIQYPHISSSQGLVWFNQKVGTRWVWLHGGGDQGVSTLASFCLDDNTAVVVLSNLNSYTVVNAVSTEIFNRLSDHDLDSFPNLIDNCPYVTNNGQEDRDYDGIGDSCDNCIEVYNPDHNDSDFDGVGDSCDNCLYAFNPEQEDGDGDNVGDSCDVCPGFDDLADVDGDNVPDSCDNCVFTYNPDQTDNDQDGIGDACDHICGDADRSDAVDIDDVVYLIQYIFADGPPPDPLDAGDTDCSGGVDIDDVVYVINHIFGGGNTPCDPDSDEVPDC